MSRHLSTPLRRVLSVLILLALITVVQPPSAAEAAPCGITQLEPRVAEFMASQGVGSYARLTRGKEAIAKAFLTLPTTCTPGKGQSINITGATLTVSGGASANPLFTNLSAAPALPATIQPDSPADPIFVVPPANLVQGDGSSEVTPTFTLRVTYTRTSGTTVQANQIKEFTATKTIERRTNALRIYVVPMGDASQPYSSQFTSTDQAIVQNAMQALSRIYPVPAGVSDLTGSGGVRYLINTAGILNLKSVAGAYSTTDPTKFCGTTPVFTNGIKGLLAQYLLSHNTANPSAPADRVVGVVNGSLSLGSGDSGGCADGMASVSSAESWIRLIADQPGAPSRSGALLAMEVAHTFSLDPTLSYHATTVEADGGTDRAYSIVNRSRIAADHNVMLYNNTGSPWNNNTTLVDPNDFAYLQCKLKPSGSTAITGCATPGNVGTSVAVAAAERYIIAGTTDGTPANTRVIEPFYTTNVAETVESPTSLLRLLQIDNSSAAPIVRGNYGVPWGEAVTHGSATPIQTFYAAAPGFSTASGEVRLVKLSSLAAAPLSGTTLFSTTKIAPPTITSLAASSPGGGGTTTLTRSQVTPRFPAKPDVVFLADTTGSMQPALENLKANVASIMSEVRKSQPEAQFAVASYNDPGCATDPYAYRLEQAITADAAAVQSAINTWSTVAGQGCDLPEGQLNALYILGTTGAGYRADSQRVIAWFGDASGHDPSNGRTLANAISALQSGGSGTPPPAGSGTTQRVSVDADGGQADRFSYQFAMSPDKRFVAFVSTATNLVPNDTNNAADVFVKDLGSGAIERVSVDSSENQVTGGGDAIISISDDGQVVAFTSSSSDLVPNDTNGKFDLFVRDRAAGTTRRVSVASGGTQGEGDNIGLESLVSGNGRFVAFGSGASNLVPNDTAGIDVFVHDLSLNTTELVSVDSQEVQNVNGGDHPSISHDGRYVVFQATPWAVSEGSRFNIYLRDRSAGTTQRISIPHQGGATDGDSLNPTISRDGRYVAYGSAATNLVPGDTNGKFDIFLHDRDSGITERVSIGDDESQGASDANSYGAPSVSDDGRFVAFTTFSFMPQFCSGVEILVCGTVDQRHAFVRDRQGGRTVQVDVATDGTRADVASGYFTSLSADGQAVAFSSPAANLVSGDTNQVEDVFVHRLGAAAPPPPAPGAGGSGIRVIAVNMTSSEGTSLNQVPNASSTTTGQATMIADATGGVVKDSPAASGVSAAILAGLEDLPVTVTPEVNADNCDGELSVTFDPASREVRGGQNADFTETVTTAEGTPAGTYTCQVFFKINGKIVYTYDQAGQPTTTPDPAFVHNISITVAGATKQGVTVTGTSPDPSRLTLDLVYQCRSFNFLAAVAVPPSAVTATEATFNTTVDATAACAGVGGGGGTLVPYLSDRWNRTGGGSTVQASSAPKAPTAAIYAPAGDVPLAWNGTLALRGSGHLAGTELPGSALRWSLVSPNGELTDLGAGNAIDKPAPAGGWVGIWTVRLTVTADSGNHTVEVQFGIFFQFVGFYEPVSNPPAVNMGTAGKTFVLKWSVRSGGTDVTALPTVVSTKYAAASCGQIATAAFATTSGQSVLRYDTADKQFIFNWQTPSKPGSYVFRVTLSDGSTHDACVDLK